MVIVRKINYSECFDNAQIKDIIIAPDGKEVEELAEKKF